LRERAVYCRRRAIPCHRRFVPPPPPAHVVAPPQVTSPSYPRTMLTFFAHSKMSFIRIAAAVYRLLFRRRRSERQRDSQTTACYVTQRNEIKFSRCMAGSDAPRATAARRTRPRPSVTPAVAPRHVLVLPPSTALNKARVHRAHMRYDAERRQPPPPPAVLAIFYTRVSILPAQLAC